MKQKKKLSLLLMACLCAGAAYATEKTESKEGYIKGLLCDVIPPVCGVSPQGGNGGGIEPPK